MWIESSHASANSPAGSASSSAIRASISSSAIGVAPSRQLDRGRRGGQAGVAGGLDRREHLRGRRGDRLSQLVPPGVRVTRRLPVPEPVVPAGDVAAAPREEEALRAGARPFDGLAQRAGEVGVPEQRLPAHQRRVAGEARRRPRAASRRHGRPRCTPTVSSTGRSGTTRLTVIPGALPDPKPTRAGVSERQAA